MLPTAEPAVAWLQALQVLATATVAAFVGVYGKKVQVNAAKLRAELAAERLRCDKLERRVKALERKLRIPRPKKKPRRPKPRK